MDIDIYQACPCQSGKKIKFCCSKDILPDLNQVLSLHHGKQFAAAIDKIDRLLDKVGDRACLHGLKTHILIHLKEYAEARQLNDVFLGDHPRNTLAWQHAALLLAAEGKSAEAVDALQNALDACDDHAIPITMANALRTVGMMLVSRGGVVAGRAHLIFAAELRKGEDEVVSQLVMQTFRSPEIPLILKSDFPVALAEGQSDEPWAEKFANAVRFAGRGRWRSARLLAEKLLEQFPDQPALVWASAVWSMFLADNERARQMFGQYSRLERVEHDRAVEARAISFLLDEQPIAGTYEYIRTTYSLDDVQAFTERAVASRRLIPGSILSQHFIDADGPPPADGFLLLDQDEVRSVNDASADSFPQVIGEILVYGRQTNRAARVEFFAVCDSRFDEVHESLRAVFDDLIGERASDEVVEQVAVMDHELSFKWHLPPDMNLEQRQEFVARQREREYLEIFPAIRFRPLDNRTPAEVAGEASGRMDVEALVLMVEQGADALANGTFDFDDLRKKLGLPVPQPVDPETRAFERLSPTELQRVNYQALPDDSLIRAYVLASSSGNLPVLREVAPVVLSRPAMEKYILFEMVYVMLARLSADTDAALELMQKARSHAAAADRPIGGLLIDELELRLERNRTDGCQELLRVLQTSHMQDPQNQYRLAAVLQRFGILGPDGRMRNEPAEAAEAVSPPAEGGLWTPGGSASAAIPSESGDSGDSKLWLPD